MPPSYDLYKKIFRRSSEFFLNFFKIKTKAMRYSDDFKKLWVKTFSEIYKRLKEEIVWRFFEENWCRSFKRFLEEKVLIQNFKITFSSKNFPKKFSEIKKMIFKSILINDLYDHLLDHLWRISRDFILRKILKKIWAMGCIQLNLRKPSEDKNSSKKACSNLAKQKILSFLKQPYLCFAKHERRGHLESLRSWQIFILFELFFKFDELLRSKSSSWSPRFTTIASII